MGRGFDPDHPNLGPLFLIAIIIAAVVFVALLA